jgi:hypothetical protein
MQPAGLLPNPLTNASCANNACRTSCAIELGSLRHPVYCGHMPELVQYLGAGR